MHKHNPTCTLAWLLAVFIVLEITSATRQWADEGSSGECADCSCMQESDLNWTSVAQVLFQRRRHVLMSKVGLQLTSLIVTGHLVSNKQDFDKLCCQKPTASTKFPEKKPHFSWTSGDHVLKFRCGDLTPTRRQCQIVRQHLNGSAKGTHGAGHSLLGNGVVTYQLAWADDTAVMVVTCSGTQGYAGWYVSSTSTGLTSKQLTMVDRKLSLLGFDLAQGIDIPATCEKLTKENQKRDSSEEEIDLSVGIDE